MTLRTLIAVVFAVALTASGSQASDWVQEYKLQLNAPSIDGLVHISGEGGSYTCSGRCVMWYPRNSTVKLTYENGAISQFIDWDAPCRLTITRTACYVEMSQFEMTAAARFSPLRLQLPTFGPGRIDVLPQQGAPAPVGRSCGLGCIDFPIGTKVSLRGVATAAGFSMLRWGGSCVRVSSRQDCWLTMDTNYVVSATFDRPPPPSSPGAPNTNEGPVTIALPVALRIEGKGRVVGAAYKELPPVDCSRPCSALLAKEAWVELTAVDSPRHPFRGWRGWCSGSSTKCRFYNKDGSTGRPWVTATFA